jgi:hypothetical protein
MDRRIYAGIGSRETPADVQMIMRLLAGRMEKDGWLLRSGGAKGADTAFESGVMDPRHRAIYLPGPSFNGRRAGSGGGYFDSTQLPGWQQALETVSRYHPAPNRLSPLAVNLMARNAMQVLGPSLDQPANMIVAWTPAPGGVPTGGTAQALRMAADLGIPVRNLWEPQVLEGARQFLGLAAPAKRQRPSGQVVHRIPMNFSYGSNAIPGTAPTTFDAILAGQRTSTLRKPGQIPAVVQPGSLVEVFDNRGRRQVVEVTDRRMVDRSMLSELSEAERWSEAFLDGYLQRVGGGQLEQIRYRLPGG